MGLGDSNLQPNDYQPPALSIEHSARLAESPGDHSPGKSIRRALVHSCLGNNRLVRSSSPPSPTTQSYANRDFPARPRIAPNLEVGDRTMIETPILLVVLAIAAVVWWLYR